MFEPSLPIDKLEDDGEEIKNRRVEVTRLALITPTGHVHTSQEAFTGYIMMFAKLHNFTPPMAFFVN